MTTTRARQSYVDSVVRNYLRLPGTPLRASRQDRRLAAALYDRRIPIRAVWAAFVIAATRWAIRTPQQRPLGQQLRQDAQIAGEPGMGVAHLLPPDRSRASRRAPRKALQVRS